MQILYEDNHLLVVNKPMGQLVQGDRTDRISLLEEAKAWLKQKYNKPGNVFLGLVHRLDRTASGVTIFARTSKAAARLSEEFRQRRPEKRYWALVEGQTPDNFSWTDRLERREFETRVVSNSLGKEAHLSAKRLLSEDGLSFMEIRLETGRHHQIRVQFAHRNHPILGDRRYGSKRSFVSQGIALHARSIRVKHPTRSKEMLFIAEPDKSWGKFTKALQKRHSCYWQVCRFDENHNRFVVATILNEQEAEAMIENFERKEHKQTYFKEKQHADN
jgi:RluA family pseudouridine synthase